jgi:ATP-dependent helicase Lhr and Lhr-like helicase
MASGSPVSSANALDGFSPATRAWFEGAFAVPTQAQAQAWRAISKGEDTLVIAPTGSGKTLSAFLWAIDRLAAAPPPADPKRRCRVLYVSPLKALAVDIERNLRSPLTGIRHAAHRLGLPEPDIAVAVRTGDTATEERRKLASRPPDILITTPESLFLLLTSQARETLRGVETVIIDEVHAVAGNKRGAHLALSLERLDALCLLGGYPPIPPDPPSPTGLPSARLATPAGPQEPAGARRGSPDRSASRASATVPPGDPRRPQRVGLSATVRPPEVVATFLGGAQPVTVVQPPSAKRIELEVIVPVEDMSDLETAQGLASTGPDGEPTDDPVARRSIWPHVEERVLDLIEGHKSTIVFANSRRLAERLCGRLNELANERAALEGHDGAELVIARAHHGSVSRQERSDIEEALKAGQLPAVVATSSLELGIDMGAVDLVIQVESPPSVASGLQRVGRAGHNVGDISRGVFFPKYAGDLVQSAVVANRMRAGEIEELRIPRNPLDVLAQQVVAMTALDDWPVDELERVIRRSAPFSGLTRPVLEAVLDMLAGRYPGEEFAGLKPRLVWDRVAGVIRSRPGAQKLAVTSGGTIPDRGLFGVFLPAGDGGRQPRRVGELDEEMVYESRVGDVFVLGASSWRIEDITPDRVLVLPAPGQPGKLPFWHGDTPGRPAELGKAIGRTIRELAKLSDEEAVAKVTESGLDELAAANLVRYLADQRQATGHVPDDRTLVVERFRDELGDWRVVLHSPYGDRVHAPWALAITARLRERYGGMDVQALHTDDGIIIRVPDSDEPPPAGIALIDPDDIGDIITAEVGGSALFASRFRECASRALLLPRRQPGRRTPLWQQRQRSAQLLEIASQYPGFPIVLETVRECLQDVFDVPALTELLRDLSARRIRVVEVETGTPSPFGKALLFRYIGAFMYEGDAPLAERRAQALALDPSLLAELLGTEGLRELLDPAVVAETEADLQHLSPGRRCRDREALADLLRTCGPLTAREVAARCSVAEGSAAEGSAAEGSAAEGSAAEGSAAEGGAPDGADGWLAQLSHARRAIAVRVAGQDMWAAIEDAGRLRDALGVALPVGIPEAFTAPVPDPLGDLMVRWARTHGPFRAGAVAERYGLGVAVVTMALRRLAADGRIVEGEFLGSAGDDGHGGSEWCDAEVLRLLRRRCLARLRKEVEPVPPTALGRFLPAWHGIEPFAAGGLVPEAGRGANRYPASAGAWDPGPHAPGQFGPAQRSTGQQGAGARRARRRYADAGMVLEAIERLAGAPVPASALETLVLPGRVPGYTPALLDELTSAGEVTWTGAGSVGSGDGWLVLAPAESAPFLLPGAGELTTTPLHEAVLAALDDGGGLFFRMLSDRVAAVTDDHPPQDGELVAALWDLVWAGLVTNDTFAPVRVVLGGGGQPRRSGARGASASDASASDASAGGASAGGASAGGASAGDASAGGTLAPDLPAGGVPGGAGAGAAARLSNTRQGPGAFRAGIPGVFNPRPAGRGYGRGGYGGNRGAGYGGASYRGGARRPAMPSRTGPPSVTGRWSLLPDRAGLPDGSDGTAATMRAHALALTLLDRHGVLTRGAVAAERVPGGFAAVYPVLRAMEETGQCRRGYFVEGLGAAQFALPGAVDRMRALAGDLMMTPAPPAPADWELPAQPAAPTAAPFVLAAADPAQPYGAALPWPERPEDTATGHKPGRKAGALVILANGALVLYVERGGKSLLSWTDDPALLEPCAAALAAAVRDGALGRITVERADGGTVRDTPLARALQSAGFRPTPRGLRLRG